MASCTCVNGLLFLFMIYIMTLSVAQTVQHQIVVWLVNELGGIWEEAANTKCVALSWYLPAAFEGNHTKPQLE
jgi:hypothetical protein